MTITQAEIDDLRRKADEALEVEEEWGPLIRGRCCDDCDIRYAFQDAANPERITRLLDAHKAQAERIETLEGALSSAHERLYNHDLCLCESESGEICDAAAALGETEEG